MPLFAALRSQRPSAFVLSDRAFAWTLLIATLLAGALTLAAPTAQAQVSYDARHRPQMDYRFAETDHVEWIYPAGADTTTALFQNALRRNFQSTRSIVGTDTEDFDLPVVVDPISGRANGFVTPTNFRSHLFTAHPTSSLGAKFDSWGQTVAPHELTHAMHLDLDSGVGIGGLLGLFSEDASRFIHGLAPSGWFEGIAVYRESQIKPNAGRLNAPLSTMKYRAALGSGDPWSVGEVMYPSVFERPSNRHYLGGGQLIEHMTEKRGDAGFFRRATRWNHRLPFLGFGMAMWMGTGQTPAQLSDSFLKEERQEEQRRLDSLRQAAEQGITDPTVVAGTEGLHVRRPYWLSDSTLVAYASGYATRPGFYRIDVRSGKRNAISHQAITQGYTYALGPDTTALYFARQHSELLVSGATELKTHRLNLRTGEASLVSETSGAFTPAKEPGGPVWAARRDGSFSELVTLGEKRATSRARRPGLRYKQVAPSPSGDTIAILANTGGKQGLYRFNPSTSTLEPWLRFEGGTIYDVSWGPEGRYVLFAADPSGIANVYALDRRNGDVRCLTTVRYGALEPALSPGRKRVAFARYQHERFELATIPFRPESPRPVADIERDWVPTGGVLTASADSAASRADAGRRVSDAAGAPRDGLRSDLDAASLRAQSRPYEAWRHLFPRSATPVLRGVGDLLSTSVDGENLGLGPGLKVSGADPLGRWAYNARGFYQADRLWGDVSVETGLLPGTPSLTAFNGPVEAVRETGAGPSRLEAFELRGIGLGVDQRFVFQKNVYSTSLTASLAGEYRQSRPITTSGVAEGDFTGRATVRSDLTFGYRIQKNIRDLVPNTGVRLNASAEVDVLTPAGATPSRFFQQRVDVFWPLLSGRNVGLRTSASFLTQSRRSFFDVQSFVPRGYQGLDGALPGAGNYLRLGAKITQPLWYIDTGSVMLPVAIDALYGYGLGQAQYRIGGGSGPALSERRASVGTGLGLRFRPFGSISLNLEIGVSYRIDARGENRWAPHLR
jgi:Tol biopolymer transport system component